MNKQRAQRWDATNPVAPRAAVPKANLVGLKQIVTIRLDTDMLAWYKGAGAGYQTRINRMHMRQHRHMTQHRDENGGEPNQSNAL